MQLQELAPRHAFYVPEAGTALLAKSASVSTQRNEWIMAEL
jgi:hypothetical protein